MARGLKISRKKLMVKVDAGDPIAIAELQRRLNNEAIDAERIADKKKMRNRRSFAMGKPGGWVDLQGLYHNPEPEVALEPKGANAGPFYVEPAKRKAGEYAAYLEITK